jgi:integrase
MRRVRHNEGSVLFDKGRGTWRFLQWVDGKRRSQTLGTKQELANKAAAWKVASALMPKKPKHATGFTVRSLVDIYRAERMPQRFSTRYSYDQWLTNHILPRWGEGSITDVKPRPVELWLHSLKLSPKSRVHIRGVLHQLWEFAMWRGDLPAERNPMTLVTVRGATKRTNAPRSLTFEEFQKFVLNPRNHSARWLCCVCAWDSGSANA